MTKKGLQLNKSYLIPLLAGKGRRRNFWFFFFFFFFSALSQSFLLKLGMANKHQLCCHARSKNTILLISYTTSTQSMKQKPWTKLTGQYSFRTTTPCYRHLCLSLNKNHIT
ncbi:hypothetical protein NC653_017281 [Populus alba x Populus x berolinensis]|uniref:Uncharacterized protein n=1 Tax=Populus alba x Populus x berolinensis TaxID=444605 RepID=A0AAD6QPZ6_9ROSI|nr:hypothetical protein NC653_017281 [Populus alba x Populus x berolinensis]